ncbi:metalloregulator ArsR/SmtB family transcription factor [Streptomyces sp. NPDC049881]|uniref:ArsR/SmtB family transcription factor n=1 Tax=unclassified Streptomyces TaxID=2593676 RepID=UPI00341FB2BE
MCQHRGVSQVKDSQVPGREAGPCCPSPAGRVYTAEEAEGAARMFKALGDPVRLRLFTAVAAHGGEEVCVCDIPDVGVSQPTVSHHLKKLREAGLLTSERRGTWVFYRVEPAVLAAMARMLTAAAG